MRNRLWSCLLGLAMVSAACAQEQSLGYVARASRAHQAVAPKPAKVFSNEESNPQAIKDGEDPLEVFTRARTLFLHDTSHRCQQESSGNSGPGGKGSETFEVAAADRMRFVFQEGSRQGEWLFVGDSYYQKAEVRGERQRVPRK